MKYGGYKNEHFVSLNREGGLYHEISCIGDHGNCTWIIDERYGIQCVEEKDVLCHALDNRLKSHKFENGSCTRCGKKQ